MKSKDQQLLEEAYTSIFEKTAKKILGENYTSGQHPDDPLYGVPEDVEDTKYGYGNIFDACVENRLDYDKENQTYMDPRSKNVFKFDEGAQQLKRIGKWNVATQKLEPLGSQMRKA